MVNFNTSHINITWGIPASPNGQVNYTVVVQEIDLLTREITLIEMLTISEENLIVMYRVRPYSMYNVSVTSLTIVGEGDVVMESFITDEAGEDDVNVIIYAYMTQYSSNYSAFLKLIRLCTCTYSYCSSETDPFV